MHIQQLKKHSRYAYLLKCEEAKNRRPHPTSCPSDEACNRRIVRLNRSLLKEISGGSTPASHRKRAAGRGRGFFRKAKVRGAESPVERDRKITYEEWRKKQDCFNCGKHSPIRIEDDSETGSSESPQGDLE